MQLHRAKLQPTNSDDLQVLVRLMTFFKVYTKGGPRGRLYSVPVLLG